MRRNLPVIYGIISLTLPRLLQAREEVTQPQQVRGAEQRSTPGYRDERLKRDRVCPCSRQRTKSLVLVVKVHPMLSPGLLVREQLKFSSVQRMVRVCDPEDLHRSLCIRCS